MSFFFPNTNGSSLYIPLRPAFFHLTLYLRNFPFTAPGAPAPSFSDYYLGFHIPDVSQLINQQVVTSLLIFQ